MRAWIYARLSKDDDQELNSLLNQQAICQEFCIKQGYQIVGTSFDNNISGMTFSRPGLDKLIVAADAGRIDSIVVKDLYKIYRVGETKVRALNGVDFTIDRGNFCSIVGTSGSGKSTLLNMMAGLEKPTKGEIIIAGEHMERKTENQLVAFRREHIGFIFQSFNLLGTMNAIENVALPLTFQGMDKKSRNRKAEDMLDLVGLTKHKKHRPNQMSGGQQQRVGVARALVVEPEIIFADEPTGNLDSNTSVEVMNLMKRIVREKNQTLVMVTHDNYLAGFADVILRIKDGKIVEIEDNRGKEDRGEIEAI